MSQQWEYLNLFRDTFRDKSGNVEDHFSIWRPNAEEAEKRDGSVGFLRIANELGLEGWELVTHEVLTHDAHTGYLDPDTGRFMPGFSMVRSETRTFKRPVKTLTSP